MSPPLGLVSTHVLLRRRHALLSVVRSGVEPLRLGSTAGAAGATSRKELLEPASDAVTTAFVGWNWTWDGRAEPPKGARTRPPSAVMPMALSAAGVPTRDIARRMRPANVRPVIDRKSVV